MNGYTDETFEAWYERLTDLEQYDYDTSFGDTFSEPTPQQETDSTMTYTYSLINPTSDRDFPALLGSLILMGFTAQAVGFRTIQTTATPENVDPICCDLHILVEHEGQWLGCND